MKILTLYYSMYGHMLEMAKAVHQGVASVEGVQAVLRRAEEFDAVEKAIDENEFAKSIREKQKVIPTVTMDDLREAQGMVVGSPTRFGLMAAQMKQVFDSAGALWAKGEMEGKPVGLFTSTGTTHGGQETTLYTMMPPLIHLGMIIVSLPYSTPGMLHTEARGGSPYGASTIAGSDGSLSPHPTDLEQAKALGRRVAQITKKLRS